MSNTYIEPRINRDFSGILTAFVDFLKAESKSLFSVFITYNFILIILLFLTNYIVDAGISSIVAISTGNLDGYLLENAQQNNAVTLIGTLATYVLTALIYILNSSLAGSYMKLYEGQGGTPEKKLVFKRALGKMLGSFVILFLGAICVIPVAIVGVIMIFIPILGLFAFAGLIITYFTWIGLSVFCYAYTDEISMTDAMGRGWQLLFFKFWKAFFTSFVALVVLYILSILFQILPAMLIGFYSMNSNLDNIELQNDFFIEALSFLFYGLNSISGILVTFISMFIFGFIYLNLHESKYNVYLKTRVERLDELSV